jgi:DNA invertase Pin-like site-specific DNA recombinase
MASKGRYGAIRAVIYLRVSSKEQECGYSIPAQLRFINEYAARYGIEVVGEPIIEIASAKNPGRKDFQRMVGLLKKEARKTGARINGILTEKTDRLVRNHRDKELLLDLGVTLFLTKENLVVNKDSMSQDLYMFDSMVSSAVRYSRNLGEEASKGMQEKAEEGWYPSRAPIGYKNVVRADEKRVIEIDRQYGPVVIELFEQYATGRHSLKTLVSHVNEYMKNAGLKRKLQKSTVSEILDNPFYCGTYFWNGKQYDGKHKPLITREIYERVQGILHGTNKHARQSRDKDRWLFQGMIFCDLCGCAVVAERKKGLYTYYHCTGNRGECVGKRVVEQRVLEEQVVAVLKQLCTAVLPLDMFSAVVRDSQSDERSRQAFTVARITNEIATNESRRQELLMRSLDGKISDERFEQADRQLAQNIAACEQQLHAFTEGRSQFLETPEQLAELLRKAVDLFQKPARSDAEKRRLVKTFLGRCRLKNGRLLPVLRQPFARYVSP